MKFCKNCKHTYSDTETKCSNCNRNLTEITDKNEPVYLITASGFEYERIANALNDSGIPCSSVQSKENFGKPNPYGMDLGDIAILVPYSAYEQAYDVCVGIGAIKLDETEVLDEEVTTPTNDGVKSADEEFEEMSGVKRTTVKVVSAIILLLIIAGVIYGTDFITGFIKGLFG